MNRKDEVEIPRSAWDDNHSSLDSSARPPFPIGDEVAPSEARGPGQGVR